MYRKTLEELLDESTESFPVKPQITVLAGKTLTKTPSWHKAILLVETDGKKQLRLYGWQLDKHGVWKQRQKFNIAKQYAPRISEIIDSFLFED